jgi:phenylacetic acid degradation protein paaN
VKQDLFAKHEALLNQAVTAIQTRGYWSPFPESPSPRVYGEGASEAGKQAFESLLGHEFKLDLPGAHGTIGAEKSPFGIELGITYPKVDVNELLPAVERARESWRRAGPKTWVGVSAEILTRLNKMSFEMAYAIMHTTGQAFMMAFQAGGPHAQDRGLEAVAYAWAELGRIPESAIWEKPQGKNEPLRMEKQYYVVPRGIGLVIGCCTFPTWNSYPGFFADLATGNAVIVKPHPSAVLPLALTVKVAREVLAEQGFDPNVVTLVVHDSGDQVAQDLARRPEIRIIDFTGSAANGNWLEEHAKQAIVFTEKSGINQVILDSTNDARGMARNLAFSLALYSGQMCTAPQNIYIPENGIDTAEGHLSFDQVVAMLGDSITRLVSDPAKAVELLGAIQNTSVCDRIDKARNLGTVVVDSTSLTHPEFADARIRTPLFVKMKAGDEKQFSSEQFGPIAFAIPVKSTDAAIDLAERVAREHGGLTLSVYSTNGAVLERARELSASAGVSVSLNLTGNVFVNQSAAYSDYHGTGANPAANSALTDAAFVARRFTVAQSRAHI